MTDPIRQSRFIRKVNYRLGDIIEPIELSPRLTSSYKFLRSIGFANYARFSDPDSVTQSMEALIKELSITAPEKVFFYSALSTFKNYENLTDMFVYKESKIMHDTGMNGTPHAVLRSSGCSGVFEAIELARNHSGDVVCVSGDEIPNHMNREVQYNVMSDAASIIVIGNSGPLRIMGTHTVYAQQFWNTTHDIEQITASYFTFASRCIAEILSQNNLKPSDIDIIIPHNVNLKSWEILTNICAIPTSKLFSDNIARIGHTISSDLAINLSDALRSGKIKKNNKVLAFTYGFGSSWSAILMEAV